MKTRYISEVSIQNGKIRRSLPVNLDAARDEQKTIINAVKPVMNTWLRSKISQRPELSDSEIIVRTKYSETSNGLTIEFKVQSIRITG
jgi:hypothetical protein